MNRTQILELAATNYYTNREVTFRDALRDADNLMKWLASAQRELNEILGVRS